jgi:formate dehydrogenase major subunit/NADH-quinone oxidoreductase subunit G
MVTLKIDGLKVEAKEGEKILWAALDNGIYIPNLCAIREQKEPFAACRLCFVEVDGKSEPVTACTEPVVEGMIVHTNTPRVNRLRQTAFELLLSHHHLDCRNCPKNGNCELQNIARRLGFKLKLKRFRQIPKSLPIDSSHPLFTYDPNKCVLCGKCVWVCNEQSVGTLNFAFRGINSVVSTFDNTPLGESSCNSCLKCVDVCPVGALQSKASVMKVRESLL